MENLRQRTSVTDYANQFSGLLPEIPHMHPADAIYQFVRGLKAQIRLHVELQRPSTVNDAIRLAQAADSALYCARPTYPFNRPTPPPTYMGPQPMQLGAPASLDTALNSALTTTPCAQRHPPPKSNPNTSRPT